MGFTRRLATAVAAGAVASISVPTMVLASPAGAQTPNPVVGPVITTYAGSGQGGFTGDGGSAAAAKLFLPGGVASDVAGNVYIADTLNNRVRRVSMEGLISTVAGSSQFGFGGDGGPAAAARLALPSAVAVDGSGDLYIADTMNNRVRKVAPNGVITTVAGDGSCRKGENDRPAIGSSLCQPSGVAVDRTLNLFVADSGHNAVRMVTSGGTMTTFAGSGRFGSSGDGGPAAQARLGLPTGVAVDALHDVFIADTGNNKIRKVGPAGLITTLAGTQRGGFSGDGGSAAQARLRHPTGVGVDPLGNVYITDTFNERIRVVGPTGTITTYAGTGMPGFSGDGGPATQARLFLPTGSIAASATAVIFADRVNERVRVVRAGPPPNIPETPFSVALLPLSAAALLGGCYLIVRRRQAESLTPAAGSGR